MRKPSIAAPSIGGASHLVTPIADLDLSVITPLFGGSVTPGRTDPQQPVTGKSVRGHLRFWWRTCNARRFSTLKEMYDEESRIWGAPARKGAPYQGPSPVIVGVTNK